MPKNSQAKALRISVAAGWAFFLFGYDTGVVSTAMTWTKQSLRLSGVQYEVAVAITTCFAGVFALVARSTNAQVGRRGTVLQASLCFLVGAVLVASAQRGTWGYCQLLLGRVGIGAGCGLATTSVPIYIAEVAPAELRGTLLSVEIFFTVLGQACAGAVNGLLASLGRPLWRVSMGAAAAPALVLFGIFYSLPETPRWLVQQGRFDDAERVLAELNGGDVQAQLEAIRGAIGNDELGITQLWSAGPQLRRAMAIGVFLMILQQLAAINTIMYYSTFVFEKMGYSTTIAAWLTCACAATQGAGILVTVLWKLPDVVGRRPVLVGSVISVSLALVGFALTFAAAPAVSLVFIFLYLFAFGLGLSPIPWAVNSEIYPMHARSAAAAQATFANWETNFLVSVTFVSVLNACGALPTFLAYAIITLAGGLVVVFFLPETARQNLEDVFADFKGNEGGPLHDRMLDSSSTAHV